MTLNTDDFHFILAQFLLVDPTSEAPRIHPEYQNITQLQLQKMLALWIEQAEEAQLDVSLEEYKLALKSLRNIKKKADYQRLLLEIVESYEDLSNQRLTQEKERAQVKKEKARLLEKKASTAQGTVGDKRKEDQALTPSNLWQSLMQKVTKNKGQK